MESSSCRCRDEVIVPPPAFQQPPPPSNPAWRVQHTTTSCPPLNRTPATSCPVTQVDTLTHVDGVWLAAVVPLLVVFSLLIVGFSVFFMYCRRPQNTGGGARRVCKRTESVREVLCSDRPPRLTINNITKSQCCGDVVEDVSAPMLIPLQSGVFDDSDNSNIYEEIHRPGGMDATEGEPASAVHPVHRYCTNDRYQDHLYR